MVQLERYNSVMDTNQNNEAIARLQARSDEIERRLDEPEQLNSSNPDTYTRPEINRIFSYDNIATSGYNGRIISDGTATITTTSGVDNTVMVYSPYDSRKYWEDCMDTQDEVIKTMKEKCPYPNHSEQAKLWREGFWDAVLHIKGGSLFRDEVMDSDTYQKQNSAGGNETSETEENEETEGFEIEEETSENEMVTEEVPNVQ